MRSKFDSSKDTLDHISKVSANIESVVYELRSREGLHDRSKLAEPEKSIFDEVTPKLAKLTYGSDEYKDQLNQMKVALDHHYEVNRHHPEHFENGIQGMNLVDLIEMICDWKAASQRHSDGDIFKSIEINQQRFGYSDDVKQLLINTVKEVL